MKIQKALRRDVEIERRKNGHHSDGNSVKLIQEIERKRAEKIKQERQKKEELQEVISLYD